MNEKLMPNKWIKLLSYTNDQFLQSIYDLNS
jgi:hypothetical protein